MLFRIFLEWAGRKGNFLLGTIFKREAGPQTVSFPLKRTKLVDTRACSKILFGIFSEGAFDLQMTHLGKMLGKNIANLFITSSKFSSHARG